MQNWATGQTMRIAPPQCSQLQEFCSLWQRLSPLRGDHSWDCLMHGTLQSSHGPTCSGMSCAGRLPMSELSSGSTASEIQHWPRGCRAVIREECYLARGTAPAKMFSQASLGKRTDPSNAEPCEGLLRLQGPDLSPQAAALRRLRHRGPAAPGPGSRCLGALSVEAVGLPALSEPISPEQSIVPGLRPPRGSADGQYHPSPTS